MTYEDKFLRRASVAGPAFEAAVRQKFGFDSKGVGVLLDIAARLSSPAGATLSDDDVVAFANMHPGLSLGAIADWAVRINKAAPDRRAEMFTGTLAGDLEGMYGNHVDANDNFRTIGQMVENYVTEDYAAAINARMGGTRGASKPWAPNPGSVKALLERASTPQSARDLRERFDAGDPQAEATVRSTVADRMDDSLQALRKPEASLHDTLSASFDYHEGEAFAQEEFGLDPGEHQ